MASIALCPLSRPDHPAQAPVEVRAHFCQTGRGDADALAVPRAFEARVPVLRPLDVWRPGVIGAKRELHAQRVQLADALCRRLALAGLWRLCRVECHHWPPSGRMRANTTTPLPGVQSWRR